MGIHSRPDLTLAGSLFNKHRGETGLLVATGPSLEQVPLEFLKKYPSMSMNQIFLMFPRFVPNYYIRIGLTHFDTDKKRQDIIDLISHPDCKAAFISRIWAFAYPWEKVISTMGYIPEYGQPVGSPAFSFMPLIAVGTATNTVYPSLQIMYWMGFETVLIVGMDHHYDANSIKKHFYEDTDTDAKGYDISPGPAYTVEEWKERGDRVLKLADQVYKAGGRRILNLTEGSQATAFEFDKIANW